MVRVHSGNIEIVLALKPSFRSVISNDFKLLLKYFTDHIALVNSAMRRLFTIFDIERDFVEETVEQ